MSKKTVFLSHSSKDIEKVRQIRDILEAIDYEPLLFHLKCLDDDNNNLETFIKKEIEARNIFIYCKSENSDNSPWVQKELEYIKSFDTKRLFTIDITLPFSQTLVNLLKSITEIIKNNRVFISCSHSNPDKTFGNYLEKLLIENNYDVVRFKTLDYDKDNEHKKALMEANTFISIISPMYINSRYCIKEYEHVMEEYENSPSTFTNKVIPIYFGNPRSLAQQVLPHSASISSFESLEISTGTTLTPEEIKQFFKLLNSD